MPLVREVTGDQEPDTDVVTGLDTVASAKYLASEKLREKRKATKKPSSNRTSRETKGKKKAAKSSSKKRN